MNLFIIGWNLPEDDQPVAVQALQRAAQVYPQLDPETLWQRSSACGTVFAAALHTAIRAAGPRRYITEDSHGYLLFCGLPLCPTEAYPAHQARSLWTRWDRLDEELEGQYFIARVNVEPVSLELMGDFLGMEQVFYAQHGDAWVISNSVQAIEGVIGPRALDPLGVSLFLGIGWVGADRTLREGIQVFPAGQRWTWRGTSPAPEIRSVYGPSNLSRLPRRSLTGAAVAELAANMTAMCRSLHQSFDEVESPLTAGRDSRLLAALQISADLPAQYYTSGDPASADVQIGSHIAGQFGLSHHLNPVTVADVAERWDQVSWQYVRRYDGMSSFWQIADVLHISDQINELSVTLWGIGGEIGRGFYAEPGLFLNRPSMAGVQRFLAGKAIARHDGLVRPAAEELARHYLQRFVAQCVAEGLSPLDAPDLFYTYQRIGRWAGNNSRKTAPICDHFSPFCSRAYVEATFSLSALQRYTEPLHYNLILSLMPVLHSLPFEKGPWRNQQPLINLFRQAWSLLSLRSRRRLRRFIPRALMNLRHKGLPAKSAKTFDHAHWLEAKLPSVREVCLDQRDSPLWQFVDRTTFEELTSHRGTPEARVRHSMVLFSAVTLFYYEADRTPS